jgi:hypothetical protein
VKEEKKIAIKGSKLYDRLPSNIYDSDEELALLLSSASWHSFRLTYIKKRYAKANEQE